MKGIKFFLLFVMLYACSSPRAQDRSIQGILSSRQESFRQCYVESDSYQGRHDLTDGKVDVNFIINKDGTVKDERIIKSEFKDANLNACILHQLREIKFEPQDAEVTVAQPINFHPVII